jgi:predicted TIM-barrel fold metal-dependent hydrolase
MTAPWTTAARLDRYLRRARAAGIDRTVVMPTFASSTRRANAELAHLIRTSPSRLIGFAWIHPKRDAGRVEDLVGEATRLGLSGIKVHASDALPTREVCEAAARHGLPVLVDVFAKSHAIEMFAPEYKSVPFIVAHLGSFADDFRAHLGVIDSLVRHPNVYADTSGVRRFDYLVEAVRRAGARKLLFGSDGPWLHPALELQKVRLLGLSPDHERLILGENLLRLLPGSRAPRIRRATVPGR